MSATVARPKPTGPPPECRLFVCSTTWPQLSITWAGRPWAVLGIQGPPDDTGVYKHWISAMPRVDPGSWQARWQAPLEHFGGITDDVIEHWIENANGLTWDFEEIEGEEVPWSVDLGGMVEAFVDRLLADPIELRAAEMAGRGAAGTKLEPVIEAARRAALVPQRIVERTPFAQPWFFGVIEGPTAEVLAIATAAHPSPERLELLRSTLARPARFQGKSLWQGLQAALDRSEELVAQGGVDGDPATPAAVNRMVGLMAMHVASWGTSPDSNAGTIRTLGRYLADLRRWAA